MLTTRPSVVVLLLAGGLLGCGGAGDGDDAKDEGACAAPAAAPPAGYPLDPAAFERSRGPGGPSMSFATNELLDQPCGFLDGGEKDVDHHNTVTMFDGYLVMPWSPEFGTGGVSVFDFSNPCAPVTIATAHSEQMRETHAAGFSLMDGRWMAVNRGVILKTGGIEIWDVADLTNPSIAADLDLEGTFYPDSYTKVVLSLFWQAPYVYVAAADVGLFVVDASNPREPKVVTHYQFPLPLRAGGVFAIGNLLVVTAAEGARTALLDISDPANPEPWPGGIFLMTDGKGEQKEPYHSHVNGNKLFYANKGGGGGLVIWNIADPTAPAYLGDLITPAGNGGYVFVKDEFAFVGDSGFGDVIDISDPAQPKLVKEIHLVAADGVQGSPGDFDTLQPIGNVLIASSDDSQRNDTNPTGDMQGRASQVFPWLGEPDAKGPHVTMANPEDGAVDQALTSRVGLTFSEFVDASSLWKGSIQVLEEGCLAPVAGDFSGQEGIVNFWPKRALKPNTRYDVVVPAGGVLDYNGNATESEFRSSFTTGAP